MSYSSTMGLNNRNGLTVCILLLMMAKVPAFISMDKGLSSKLLFDRARLGNLNVNLVKPRRSNYHSDVFVSIAYKHRQVI